MTTLLPVAAVATIVMALVWNLGLLPWTTPFAEIFALVAVLVAPGLAIEPAIRGPGWSPLERFGFAGAISIACVVVAGLGLHLFAIPISARNVLFLVLAVSVAFGLLSLRSRNAAIRRMQGGPWNADVVVGVGSVLLLTTAFLAFAAFRAAPNHLPLEVAIVDSQGRLLVLPLKTSSNTGTVVNLAVRSPSGEGTTADVSVAGDDVSAWASDDVPLTREWSIATVPIVTHREGTIRATIEIISQGSQLTLPVEIVVDR